MNNIKGRHWVFILGILLATITSIWSPMVAGKIISLLFAIGVGLLILEKNKTGGKI